MSWSSQYSLTLNNNNTGADFGGWVTIDNNSGKKYANVAIKLLAGSVNTVNTSPDTPLPTMLAASSDLAAAAPTFQQQSFADYHLYTLSETITLSDAS